ncbi:hypothetical protein [Rhabdochlamydiaceae symbiont of Dictyostelium giganteum]|uniref:hypothetical protein n=1 Tax=Rhabdochlamydiaceae symbiont of Dictyostelium giganteum TaxID=3342349 RepID=UPI00384EDFD3
MNARAVSFSLLCQLISGALLIGFTAHIYLQKQNACTAIKMKLPHLVKEIQKIHEKNEELHYQVRCFENPEHLIYLAQAPHYSHLKFPFTHHITKMQEGLAVELSTYEEKDVISFSRPSIVIGAK